MPGTARKPPAARCGNPKKTTISYSDNTFHKQTFSTGALPLTPGAKYVLFASVTKDYAQCTSNDALMWGSVDDKSYRGGTFVYLNNASDKTQWTEDAVDHDLRRRYSVHRKL